MKLLVTGATGFLGRHLIRSLVDRDNRVSIIVREDSTFDLSRFDRQAIDVHVHARPARTSGGLVELAALGGVGARQQQARPGLLKSVGQRRADPSRGAGDKHHLSFEGDLQASAPLLWPGPPTGSRPLPAPCPGGIPRCSSQRGESAARSRIV